MSAAAPGLPIWPEGSASALLDALGAPAPGPSVGLHAAAEAAGRRLQPCSLSAADWLREGPRALAQAAPAVVLLEGGRMIGLPAQPASPGAAGLLLAAPEGPPQRAPAAALERLLFGAAIEELKLDADAILDAAGAPISGRPKARAALLQDRLGSAARPGVYLLRADGAVGAPWAGLGAALREAGALRSLGRTAALELAAAVAAAGAAVGIGASALSGRADPGWLLGWALALGLTAVLEAGAALSGGELAVRVGAALKERLLRGALRASGAALRAEGVGGLLSRAIEGEQLQALVLGGGLGLLRALLLLLQAALLTATTPSPWPFLLLIGGSLLLSLGALAGQLQAQRREAAARAALTASLVERTAGHRTRVAQQRPERWHLGEDELLCAHLSAAQRSDRAERAARLLPRAALGLGLLLALLPRLQAPDAPRTTVEDGVQQVRVEQDRPLGQRRFAAEVAVALLLAAGLRALARSGGALSAATVGLDRAGLLLRAPATAERGAAEGLIGPGPLAPGAPLLQAEGLGCRGGGEGPLIFSGIDLEINAGERILIEGASGSGKSTLAAALSAAAPAAAGVLRLRGLDPKSLGLAAWRRRVVLVPQLHENHLFNGTLAFNLLLGRAWPAEAADLAAAEAVCAELGLEPLLLRMPAGLQQPVGERGWQLSQGEKARVYLGRALLMEPELLILDEGLGALDPETMAQCLKAALRRRCALIVIAHP
jgi:ATP-binding cassette subfamily B protein